MTISHGSTSNVVTTESPRPRLPTTRLGDTPGQYCYPRDCTPDRAVALGLLVDVTPEAREVTLSGYPILFSRWAYDEHVLSHKGRDGRGIPFRVRRLLRRMYTSMPSRPVKYPEDLKGTFLSLYGRRLTVEGRMMNIGGAFYALVISEPL